MICHGDLRAVQGLLHHVPHRVVCVRFRVAVRATEGGELARFIVGKAGAKGCPALRARLLRHSVIQVVPVRQGHVLVGLPHQVPDRIISVFRCQGSVAGPGEYSVFFNKRFIQYNPILSSNSLAKACLPASRYA